MVASIKPHRDELGLPDGLVLTGWTWDHGRPAAGEQVGLKTVWLPLTAETM